MFKMSVARLLALLCLLLSTGSTALQAQTNAVPTTAPGFFSSSGQHNQITLKWDPVSDATGYNLWRSSSTSTGYSYLKALGNVTSYVDTNLTNGTTYYYAINAVNAYGASPAFSYISGVPEAGSTFIPCDGVVDIAYNSARRTLYVSKGTNAVLSYNIDTKSFGDLLYGHGTAGAMDISPDGTKLVVADRTTTDGLSYVTINNLTPGTGIAGRTVSVASVPYETGIASVAFSGNDTIVTTSSSTSLNGTAEYLPFRKYNLLQNQWSTLTTLEGVRQRSLNRSADGSIVGIIGTWSNQSARYRASDGDLKFLSSTAPYKPYFGLAVNGDGSQIAGTRASEVYFYDKDFTYLRRVTGYGYNNGTPTNIVYHPRRALAYITLAGSGDSPFGGEDEVGVIDSATFQKRGSYIFNTSFSRDDFEDSDGRLKVSDDGTLLFAIVKGGIRYVDLTNELPVAQPDSFTIKEDETTFLPVTANDTDAENGELRVVKDNSTGQSSSYLAYSYAPTGINYTPPANYSGTLGISYKVKDPNGGISAFARATVTITPVNDAPEASSQTVTTNEDTAKNITLAASDVENDALSFSVVAQPAHGILSGTAPNLVYTPNADFNGSDSFQFKANDGTVDSNTATVNISVTAVNDAPVASNQSVTTNEDTAKSITLLATDIDSATLTYLVIKSPSKGTLSGTAPNLIYTPNADFNGSDFFQFVSNDGTVDGSNTATVSITVTPVNDVPVSSTQSITTSEDTAKNITLSATDAEGDTLTFNIVTPPSNGVLSGTAPNLVYTPKANFNGSDSFTFKANDGTADSNAATVNIAVTPVNDAPVADNQSVTTNQDTAKAITLSATDADGDALTYGLVTLPSRGSLSGTGANVVYTPNLNFSGSDSFQFIASDSVGGRSTGTVNISVLAVNRAPVSSTQSVTTNEDTAKSITLSASDADGNALTYSVVTPPARGTLSGTAPNLVYTPNANFNGSDAFSFKANDGKVDSNTATVSVTVVPVNDAPVAVKDTASIVKNGVLTIAVTANDSDVDGDVLTVSSVTQGANGSVALAGGSSVKYTPKRNFFGSDTFSYTISDGKGGTATATVAVTVTK